MATQNLLVVSFPSLPDRLGGGHARIGSGELAQIGGPLLQGRQSAMLREHLHQVAAQTHSPLAGPLREDLMYLVGDVADVKIDGHGEMVA
jgi:hypothetical protein